jgi:amino acid adenylation domain-containing protein
MQEATLSNEVHLIAGDLHLQSSTLLGDSNSISQIFLSSIRNLFLAPSITIPSLISSNYNSLDNFAMPSSLRDLQNTIPLLPSKQVTVSKALPPGKVTFVYEKHSNPTDETTTILEFPEDRYSWTPSSGLSDADERLIRSWNSNIRPSLNQRLHHAFSEKALDNPSTLAVHAWDGELTYSELDILSSKLACHIAGLMKNQGNSTRVAFCFEKSKLAIVSMLAVLKAECTCIPLSATDEDYPMPNVIADVEPGIICTSAIYSHRFSGFKGTILTVDSDLLEGLEAQDQLVPEPRECPSFIHYTAGRADRPKAVLQQHASFYTGILALGNTMNYDEYSRVLQYVPYTNSISVGDIFGCFFYGGCLVVPSNDQILTDLTGSINDYDVTHAYLTPDVARTIDQSEILQLSSLALGGASLTTEDVESWSVQTELIKVYGTAETSVWFSASKSPSPNVFIASNIGTSSTASLWIVDPLDTQKLLPIGCVGELVIGGPILAHGYLNDDAANAEAFISSPVWAFLSHEQDHQRFFRTGDLVRYLEDGEVEFIGRKIPLTNLEPRGKVQTNDRILSAFELLNPTEDVTKMTESAATACKVEKNQIEDLYPVTSMQEGLFALSIKEPGAFIKQHIFTLPPTLDIERFKAAWTQVIAQSPILRTRVIMMNSNELNQVVVHSSPVFAEVSDLNAYLKDDLDDGMVLGSPLTRYAIVKEDATAYFVLTTHHAIYDGWTLSCLFERVSQAFKTKDLPPAVSFNAFVKYFQSLDETRQDEYWKTQMEEATMTSFPTLPNTFYQPNPNRTYTRDTCFTRIKGSSITTPNLVRAAWALTISRYTDSHDVTFGETLSGRNAPVKEIHSLLGPTITTVPIRVKIDKGARLSQYLQQIQDQSIGMIPFEHAGLHHIMQLNDHSRAACTFQTSIIVQTPARATGLDNLGCRRYNDLFNAYQPYALNIEFELHQSGGIILTSFDDQVIDRLQVQRIIAQFCQILEKLSLEEAEVAVDDIATITQEDLEEINRWNTTPPDPLYECVHEAFQRQVALNPSAEAIVSWDGCFSYSELDNLSTKLAHHLLSLHISLEMIVPLCFDKSRWAVVAMLAVLKSGGTCLALDPSHPVDRLRTVVSAVDGKIVLAGEAHKAKFVDSVDSVVVVDEELLNSLPNASGPLCESVRPDNRAFLIFTSGTTGAPKGIEWEHQGVCSASREHAAVFDVGPGSRCLQFTAFASDVHIADIFTALMYGGCCCIPSEEERMGHIPSAINRMKADYAYLTPTVVTLFHPDDAPSLKKVALGGETLTKENVRIWAGKVFTINDYSACEAGNWATYRHVLPDTVEPSNVGRPMGVSTWLVDPNNFNRLAPIGSVGELFIESPSLARGYFKDEKRTQSAFEIKPAWVHAQPRSTRRMYRTGDLLRYNSDGTLVFIDRKDTQVKIRGQRLEIKGVERKLSEIPTVKSSAIFFPKAGLCSKRLVAVLCLKQLSNDQGLNEIRILGDHLQGLASSAIYELRDKLAENLAAWMIPTLWIVVEEMPTNSSGKLDRNKVSAFVENLDDKTLEHVSKMMVVENFQEPETDMEKNLRRIISLVLKIPEKQISATSSFLRLGGDSITAMRIMSECRKEGILVSVKDLLQSQTVAGLASQARLQGNEISNGIKDNGKGASNGQSTRYLPLLNRSDLERVYESVKSQASLDSSMIEDIFEATDYQASALAQAMLRHRGDLAYHLFSVKMPADLHRLKDLCIMVVDKHPNLRSTFVSHRRQVYQVVSKSRSMDFQEYGPGTSVDALIEDDLEQGISLGGRLVWFKLVKSERKATLIVRLPHCLYDATTRAKLASDLQRAYEAGETISSPAESSQFLEFKSQTRPLAESYWQEYLAGSSPTQIIGSHSPNFTCSRQTTIFDEIAVNSLKQHGITIATVVKAAWALVLAEMSGQQDITFGETVSGRNLSSISAGELENVCVNIVPVRVEIRPGSTVLDLLHDVQTRQLARMPFEFLGTTSIVERCTDWPSWTQLGSVLNHATLPEEQAQGSWIDEDIRGTINASADINIMTHPLGTSRLLVKMIFDRSSVSSDYASILFQRYCGLIRDLTAEPSVNRIEQLRVPWTADTIPLPRTSKQILGCEPLSVTLPELRRIESIVQEAWQEVLGPLGEELPTNLPFYERWGSLVAAAHFLFVYRSLGVELKMEDVIKAPTIDAQVALLCTSSSL